MNLRSRNRKNGRFWPQNCVPGHWKPKKTTPSGVRARERQPQHAKNREIINQAVLGVRMLKSSPKN